MGLTTPRPIDLVVDLQQIGDLDQWLDERLDDATRNAIEGVERGNLEPWSLARVPLSLWVRR